MIPINENSLYTWPKSFCSRSLLSRWVNSQPKLVTSPFSKSGKSKNKYRHLTKVEGMEETVMTSMRAGPPSDKRFSEVNNIQPLLASSTLSISRNLAIAELAATVDWLDARFLISETANRETFWQKVATSGNFSTISLAGQWEKTRQKSGSMEYTLGSRSPSLRAWDDAALEKSVMSFRRCVKERAACWLGEGLMPIGMSIEGACAVDPVGLLDCCWFWLVPVVLAEPKRNLFIAFIFNNGLSWGSRNQENITQDFSIREGQLSQLNKMGLTWVSG